MSTALADASGDDKRQLSAVERCLFQLMAADGGCESSVVIDDRFCSRFETAGNRPIVGTLEVLAALKLKGFLSDDGYYDRLRRLREARIHFLPITDDEVLHHLLGAPIADGTVVTTPGLRALRRSLSEAILLDRGAVSVPQAELELGAAVDRPASWTTWPVIPHADHQKFVKFFK
jgi:hypothetical protein